MGLYAVTKNMSKTANFVIYTGLVTGASATLFALCRFTGECAMATRLDLRNARASPGTDSVVFMQARTSAATSRVRPRRRRPSGRRLRSSTARRRRPTRSATSRTKYTSRPDAGRAARRRPAISSLLLLLARGARRSLAAGARPLVRSRGRLSSRLGGSSCCSFRRLPRRKRKHVNPQTKSHFTSASTVDLWPRPDSRPVQSVRPVLAVAVHNDTRQSWCVSMGITPFTLPPTRIVSTLKLDFAAPPPYHSQHLSTRPISRADLTTGLASVCFSASAASHSSMACCCRRRSAACSSASSSASSSPRSP